MAVKLGSNITSLGVQRQLNLNTEALSSISEKLASGARINRASDDAAGLAISSSLKADSRIYAQSIRNISDGVSFLNIADGALESLSSIRTRQAELAEQAANGTYSLVQRKALHEEVNELVKEYNRIIQTTSFNGISIFGESKDGVRIQSGYGVDSSIVINSSGSITSQIGTGAFESLVTVTGIAGGTDTQLADVNKDGKLDIVFKGGDTYGWALGNGDGTFVASQTRTSHGFVGGAHAIYTEDVNNDGNLDIIAFDYDNAKVALGNGDGTFLAHVTFDTRNVDDQTRGSAVSDLNNDGILDLVSISYATGVAGVALGNGNGTFVAPRTFNALNALDLNSLEAVDVNRDGNIDIVTGGFGGLRVQFGNGDSTFQAARSLSNGGLRDIEVADINNDGLLDIVAATNSTEIWVFNGDGTGSFTQTATYVAGTAHASNIELADINNDGLSDIITRSSIATGRTLLLGNYDGTFGATITIGGSTSPFDIGDINSDGAVDIVGTSGAGAVYQLATTKSSAQTEYLYLLTQDRARDVLDSLKTELEVLSQQRGEVGASLQRLSTASVNASVLKLNLDNANSRIEDADVAEEAAKYLRTQIAQQVSASILGQANQSPQLALRLIRGGDS